MEIISHEVALKPTQRCICGISFHSCTENISREESHLSRYTRIIPHSHTYIIVQGITVFRAHSSVLAQTEVLLPGTQFGSCPNRTGITQNRRIGRARAGRLHPHVGLCGCEHCHIRLTTTSNSADISNTITHTYSTDPY